MPTTRLHLKDIVIDEKHLVKYNSLCGFGKQSDFVPITYPLILLFKLQSLLLLQEDFPFPGLGLVHLSNFIEQRKPIFPNSGSDSQLYHATVFCDDKIQRHKKGYCFTVIAEFYKCEQGNSESKELVWKSKSTVLSMSKLSKDILKSMESDMSEYNSQLQEDKLKACAGETTWNFPENLGRKFAALSDDYNPIHLTRLSALLFGFTKGHIIHGMCTCARALASIQCEDGEVVFYVNEKNRKGVVTFYVEFKTPVYLPGKLLLQTAAVSASPHHYVAGNEPRTLDTCFLRVMSGMNATLPHVKGYISYYS